MVVSVILSQGKERPFTTLGCYYGDDEGCDGPRRTEPGAAMEAHFDSVFSKTSKLFDASAKAGRRVRRDGLGAAGATPTAAGFPVRSAVSF
jgi:hypothetical protein